MFKNFEFKMNTNWYACLFGFVIEASGTYVTSYSLFIGPWHFYVNIRGEQ